MPALAPQYHHHLGTTADVTLCPHQLCTLSYPSTSEGNAVLSPPHTPPPPPSLADQGGSWATHVFHHTSPQLAFEDYDVQAVQIEEARRYAKQRRPGAQVVFRQSHGFTRGWEAPLSSPYVPPAPTPTPMVTIAPPRIMVDTNPLPTPTPSPSPMAPSPARAGSPPAAAAPTPLPESPAAHHRWERRSPNGQHRSYCTSHPNHPDCQCSSPPCAGAKVDTVWVHQTTMIDQPAPSPSSICYTLTSTSTYWETQLGIWQTTVFPVESTQWVWEQVPHVVTSATTEYRHKIIKDGGSGGGAGTICNRPPSDWCQDGWWNGVWKGDGVEPCWPGDPSDHGGWWHFNWGKDFFPHLYNPQIITLIMIPVFLVVITVLWAIKTLSLWVLMPFQMYTNLVHELAHCFAALLGGARICSVGIDPGCGPISTMRNGSPMFTLLAGYTGSITWGTMLVFFAFDEKSSKIMYLIHSPLWLMVFWFARGFMVKLQVFMAVVNGVVLWFVFQCRLLRFYNLFLGLMSILYVVWDTLDDLLYRKQNESDSSLLSRLVPGSRPILWALFFTVVSLIHLAMAICFGLHFFEGDIHAASVNFLPTFDIKRPDLRADDAIKKY